jgi:hypothetical protein
MLRKAHRGQPTKCGVQEPLGPLADAGIFAFDVAGEAKKGQIAKKMFDKIILKLHR